MEKFLTDLGLTEIKAIRRFLGGQWKLVAHRNYLIPAATSRWARESRDYEIELSGKEVYA